MSVALSVDDGGDISDLAAWLEAEDILRGCVRRESGPVPRGALGGELSQLAVSLGSGGAATAMASVIVAWLRRRKSTLTLRVSRPDGSMVELRAEQVRTLDAAGIREQVGQLVTVAWPDRGEPGAVEGGTPDAGNPAADAPAAATPDTVTEA
ncbi:effector-associated constant component EACC1 [Kitasatospora sp. HPMI-4]|uniref:effector-associated constant component EACC1 n=1 Tax=Kitasatospora sp. HPMI-4 TaxID=3448443 RepID=UPI003F1C4A50